MPEVQNNITGNANTEVRDNIIGNSDKEDEFSELKYLKENFILPEEDTYFKKLCYKRKLKSRPIKRLSAIVNYKILHKIFLARYSRIYKKNLCYKIKLADYKKILDKYFSLLANALIDDDEVIKIGEKRAYLYVKAKHTSLLPDDYKKKLKYYNHEKGEYEIKYLTKDYYKPYNDYMVYIRFVSRMPIVFCVSANLKERIRANILMGKFYMNNN